MKTRTPIPKADRRPIPDFTPVPRKCARHDGWTPARQCAFIAALADTGSVSRAAAMVNMAPEGAYALRRHPQAEGFRRAWEAALDCGVARMKDIAFERAIEGYLVPCFVGGKLIGWRRKYNDRLLMFCLRHYGQDSEGRRTTINYFSTKATAVAGAGAPSAATPTLSVAGAARRDAGPDRPTTGEAVSIDVTDSLRDGPAALAESSTTTVRTVISGKGAAPGQDEAAALIDSFDAVELDAEAQAAIQQALADCAARRRALAGTPDDPAEPFIAVEQPEREVLVYDPGYSRPRKEMQRPPPAGDGPVVAEDALLEPSPRALIQPEEQYGSGPGEFDWQMLDDEEGMARIEQATAEVREAAARRTGQNTLSLDGPKGAGCPGDSRASEGKGKSKKENDE